MNCDSSITEIKGVGAKTAELFQKLGVYTIGDILLRFPRDYFMYPAITSFPLEEPLMQGYVALHAVIKNAPHTRYYNGKSITTLQIGDEKDTVTITWFHAKFMEHSLIPGKHYIFFGKLAYKNNHWVLAQPKALKPEEYQALEGHLEPVYAKTEGLSNSTIVKTVKNALAGDLMLSDYLPTYVRKEQGLSEYNYCLKQIHFPDSFEALTEARKRFVFDEFFLFLMGMQYQKECQQKEQNAFSLQNEEQIWQMMRCLPFSLTAAQERTISEIITDMKSPCRMQRLIQGDVGSGKTIIAFLIMAWVSLNGYQSAIMAPTEVLARQHYESFCKLVEQFDLDTEVILLTGSRTAKERRNAYEKLISVPNAFVVGTHALIQEKPVYGNLALVITDE